MTKVNKKRRMTIGYLPRKNVLRQVRLVPAIRLAGNWLSEAGFAPGAHLEVTVQKGQLIIRTDGKV